MNILAKLSELLLPLNKVILFIVLLWSTAPYCLAADIEVTTALTTQQVVPQNQSLRVQNGGSVILPNNLLDTPAIVGSNIGEGGNTITLENGAVVQTTRPDDGTNDDSYGIHVYGTQSDNGVRGLAGGGALAGGASNIIDAQSGSTISTSGKSTYCIRTGNNNGINVGGDLSTSGQGAYGIFGYSNNDISLSGTFSSSARGAMGIISYYNGKIDISGSITTSGVNADALNFGDNHSLDLSGSINTSGERALGMLFLKNNFLTISGSITTLGDDAHGMQFGDDNNNLILSGSVNTSGSNTRALYTRNNNNVCHLSGNISATGSNSFSIYSGISGEAGESNTFHFLDGISVTGGIHNADSDDNETSYLTFGYAKDGDNKADLTAVDNAFNFSFNENITSISTGRWDGYFAGGTTSLNGTENSFRKIFVGGASFDNAAVPDGPDGAGGMQSANLSAVGGATATLNVTNAISTNGTVIVGSGSTYNLSGTHTHTGTDVTVSGTGKIDLANGGNFVNNAAGGTQSISNLNVSAGTGTLSGSNALDNVTVADIDGALNFTATADTTFAATNLSGTINQNSANSLTLTDLTVDGVNALLDGTGNGLLAVTNQANIAAAKKLTIDYDTTFNGGVSGTGELALGNIVLTNNADSSIATLSIAADKSATLTGTNKLDATTADIAGTLNYTATGDSTFTTTNLSGTISQNSVNNLTLTNLVVNGEDVVLDGAGAGALTVTNVSMINGSLDVNRAVNFTNGIAALGANSVLGGSGNIIGNVTTGGNGGRIVPTGNLNITGNLTVSGGDSVELSIVGASANKLSVTGTADFTTASIVVDIERALTNTSYDLIQAGALNNLSVSDIIENCAVLQLTPTITATTFSVNPSADTAAISKATNGNDKFDEVICAVVNGELSGLATLSESLISLNSQQQLNDAISSLSPVQMTATPVAVIAATQSLGNVISGHVGNVSANVNAGRTANSTVKSGNGNVLMNVDPDLIRENEKWTPFFETFRSWGDQDDKNGISGYNFDTTGFVLGTDYLVDDKLLIGFSMSRMETEVDSNDHLATSDIETWQGNVFTSYFTEDYHFDLHLGAGMTNIETERNISFMGSKAESDHDALFYSIGVGSGYIFRPADGMTLEPFAELNYMHMNEESYKEKGAGDANLNIDANDIESLRSTLGIRLTQRIELEGGMTITPELSYKWQHEFENDPIQSSASFVNGGSNFKTTGIDSDDDHHIFGLGLKAEVTENMSIYANYERDEADSFSANSALVGFEFKF